MSGISSSTGLVTGIPIADTINQLIAISAIPRDNLQARTDALANKQVAINDLLASVIAVQLSSKTLSNSDVFNSFNVTSSPADVVTTSVSGTAVPGSYTFQPAQRAQNQQVLSQGFGSLSDTVGAGSLSLQLGGFVNQGIELAEINGGEGFDRGSIRITDRSGASQEIDLGTAITVDDVVREINNSTDINVTASVEGDSIKIVDNTTQSVSNLIIQEVGSGTTAASLGLGGISVAASEATGSDIVYLGENTKLTTLNNGNGVGIKKGLADFEISFRDNSAALQIDLEDERTIGDVLDTINAADPARIQAQISADGTSIELIDLTADSGGSFEVTSLYGTALEDLGLDVSATGDTITGSRIQSGLGTSLLSRLGGGQGLGALGLLEITDRSGSSDSIDLSSAETLDDVLSLINASSTGVTASYNSARNGIEITDSSGGSGNLIIASGADGFETADKLQLTTNDAVSSASSGKLGLQTVSTSTRLDDLNQGSGVAASSIVITDSAGNKSGINVAVGGLETIGDVIDAINGLSIGVEARINDSGDGISIIDTAGGTGTLVIAESGNSSTAADLGILGEAVTVDIDGTPTQVIDGTTSIELEFDDEDTLEEIIEAINELDAGVVASSFYDGSEYRLSITSEVAGRDGAILIDSTDSPFSFETIAEARDAVVIFGDPSTGGSGIVVTSSSNTFTGLVPGVDFTIQQATDSPVTINVEETSKKVKTNLDLFVDSYNALIDKLDKYTSFSSTENGTDVSISTGVLFASSEALRVERTLSDLVSGSFGAEELRSLSQVGITLNDSGKLEFNETKFDELYADDPDAIRDFFSNQEEEFEKYNKETGEFETVTHSKPGIFGRLDEAIESLAGEEDSLLLASNQSIQAKLDTNYERIERMNEALEAERERLTLQFARLETTVAGIQSNQSALSTLEAIAAQLQSGG